MHTSILAYRERVMESSWILTPCQPHTEKRGVGGREGERERAS